MKWNHWELKKIKFVFIQSKVTSFWIKFLVEEPQLAQYSPLDWAAKSFVFVKFSHDMKKYVKNYQFLKVKNQSKPERHQSWWFLISWNTKIKDILYKFPHAMTTSKWLRLPKSLKLFSKVLFWFLEASSRYVCVVNTILVIKQTHEPKLS